MQREKSYEEMIEEIVIQENNSGEMYYLGKEFKHTLGGLDRKTMRELYKDYDPKKGITKYLSDEDIADVFYGNRKKYIIKSNCKIKGE